MNAWTRFLQSWRYSKAMHHMADLHPQFAIVREADQQIVTWKKQKVVRLLPLSLGRARAPRSACYVLASGPSLQAVDLDPLTDAIIFGVNGSIAKFDAYPALAPTYYVITDPDFIEHRFALVEAAFARKPHFFLSAAALSAICEQRPDLLAHATVSLIETHFCPYGRRRLSRQQIVQLVESSPALYARDWRIGFSKDIELGLFSAHTVAYYAIQIACYMGFRHVFMLGTDFNSTAQTRFYEAGAAARPSGVDKDYAQFILPSFEVLQRVCRDDPNFSVYNLAPESRLPDAVIKKISMREALRIELEGVAT